MIEKSGESWDPTPLFFLSFKANFPIDEGKKAQVGSCSGPGHQLVLFGADSCVWDSGHRGWAGAAGKWRQPHLFLHLPFCRVSRREIWRIISKGALHGKLLDARSPLNELKSFFFRLINFNWRIITLQYSNGFCHIATRIRHRYTCVPSILNSSHPSPPFPPFPPGCHRDWLWVPVSYVKLALVLLHMVTCMSLLLSHIIPPSPSPTQSKSLFGV